MTKHILANYPEDTYLLAAFRKEGTRNYAFNLLLRKYQERVYWHIRKMVISHEDADDITQDVFVKVWTKLDGFKEQSALFTWIYRIATNECLNFLKKKKRRFMLPIHDVAAELSKKIDNDPLVTGNKVEKELQKALLTLPDKQRLVFNMKYFDDMPYKEIAAVLNVSVGGLKASYHIAVKKVSRFIESESI